MSLPYLNHRYGILHGDTAGMKIFIPLCEDTLTMLGDRDRLVPYQYGMALFSQVEVFAPGEEPEPVAVSPGEARADRPAEPRVLPTCLR